MTLKAVRRSKVTRINLPGAPDTDGMHPTRDTIVVMLRILKARAGISAQALLAVRSIESSLKEENPTRLKARLASPEGVDLTNQAEYREQELRALLEPFGIEVKRNA